MPDDPFLDAAADRLSAPPGVHAESTHTADSDWDLAGYYRAAFAPADLRAIGWPG